MGSSRLSFQTAVAVAVAVALLAGACRGEVVTPPVEAAVEGNETAEPAATATTVVSSSLSRIPKGVASC